MLDSLNPFFNTKSRIYSVKIFVQYFLEKFGGSQGFFYSDLDGPVDGVFEDTIPLWVSNTISSKSRFSKMFPINLISLLLLLFPLWLHMTNGRQESILQKHGILSYHLIINDLFCPDN